MKVKFNMVFQKVPEGYIGFVEELPGANTQGATLREVRSNLKEAIAMVLEANRILKVSTLPRHREINDFLAKKICRDLQIPLI
ncbi:MAG: type II toxin-antitoxin system HicB family antitoxin [bacterium]